MSLWNMSISGGIFIAVVIIARSFLRERLQGWVFQVLWLAILFRLLVPFSIPCQLSVYTLADRCGLNVFVGESSGNRVDGTGIDGNGGRRIMQQKQKANPYRPRAWRMHGNLGQICIFFGLRFICAELPYVPYIICSPA